MKIFGQCLLLACALTATAYGDQDYSDKLAALQGQLSADPTNRALLFKAGDLCFDQGALGDAKAVELAEKYFKRLLALNPAMQWAWRCWGA